MDWYERNSYKLEWYRLRVTRIENAKQLLFNRRMPVLESPHVDKTQSSGRKVCG